MIPKSRPSSVASRPLTIVLERPSPPARVLSALLLTTSIATLPVVSGGVALAVLVCAVTALLLARPNLVRLSVRLGLALVVIAMLIAPFIATGDVERSMRLSLRALGAASVALAFTSDLTALELARALSALRAPMPLVEVLEGLTLQLDSLKGTYTRLLLARRLRGARGGLGAASLLPELLVRSAQRAERLDLARRLRGYETQRPDRCFGRQDILPLLVASASAAILQALAH